MEGDTKEKNAEQKSQNVPNPPSEWEIANKLWDGVQWAWYADALNRRKIAELNAGTYDTRPYIFRENVSFGLSVLSVLICYVLVWYLISVSEYSLALGSLGIATLATYFLASIHTRIPLELKAGPNAIELKKKEPK